MRSWCNLCVTNSTPQSTLLRCSSHQLGRDIRLCLPPPQQILHQVFQKFSQTEQYLLILMAPFWPKQAWFVDPQRLMGEKPISLPRWDKMLKQPRSDGITTIHAWKLSRPLWRRKGSPQRPLRGSWLLRFCQHLRCMPANGRSLKHGAFLKT